jgi:drug/metabolite transporter (DMT)-like permease
VWERLPAALLLSIVFLSGFYCFVPTSRINCAVQSDDLKAGHHQLTTDIKNEPLTPVTGMFTVFLCMLFGANAVAIKIAFEGLGVFTTAALRFAVAAVVLTAWIKFKNHPLAPPKGYFHQLVIISAVFAAQLSLVYFGLSKTNASRGTLLINLQPFFLLFLAHFFIPGDRITTRKLLGLVSGFAGLAIVVSGKEGVTADFRLGDSMLILATILWAGSIVYLKRVIDHHSPLQIVLYQMIFAVPVFLLEAFLWDDRMVANLSAPVLGALLYQALATASFGFVAWNTLLKKHGAVALHSFVFVMPLAGVMLSGLLLGEPITVSILLSLSLIVAGLLIIHLRPRRAVSVYPLRKSP